MAAMDCSRLMAYICEKKINDFAKNNENTTNKTDKHNNFPCEILFS
jgi:hypothetical protein